MRPKLLRLRQVRVRFFFVTSLLMILKILDSDFVWYYDDSSVPQETLVCNIIILFFGVDYEYEKKMFSTTFKIFLTTCTI